MPSQWRAGGQPDGLIDAGGVASIIADGGRDAVNALTEDASQTLDRIRQMANSENRKGVVLALVSSIFIGISFIIKKKGLMMAGQSGSTRASAGGY
jgi:hypothetical protein